PIRERKAEQYAKNRRRHRVDNRPNEDRQVVRVQRLRVVAPPEAAPREPNRNEDPALAQAGLAEEQPRDDGRQDEPNGRGKPQHAALGPLGPPAPPLRTVRWFVAQADFTSVQRSEYATSSSPRSFWNGSFWSSAADG